MSLREKLENLRFRIWLSGWCDKRTWRRFPRELSRRFIFRVLKWPLFYHKILWTSVHHCTRNATRSVRISQPVHQRRPSSEENFTHPNPKGSHRCLEIWKSKYLSRHAPEVRRRLLRITLAMDILVTTPEEFHEYKNDGRSFINEMVRAEKVAYESWTGRLPGKSSDRLECHRAYKIERIQTIWRDVFSLSAISWETPEGEASGSHGISYENHIIKYMKFTY